MSAAPRIILTPGEPAGIGPDLAVQMAQKDRPFAVAVIADLYALLHRADELGLRLRLYPMKDVREPIRQEAYELSVLNMQRGANARPGHLDPDNAEYVVEALRGAAALCMNGDFDALVTGPVHKGHLVRSGVPFRGHTEFLAALSGAPHPVMMLTAGDLRVALATTHLPLREVPAAICEDSLERTLRTLDDALRKQFGLPRPRILVCGLNPHAGDDGALGDEERNIIIPCLERLRADGMHLAGPLAADTLFVPQRLEAADAVLAMYHDQGLPVLKHAGFGRAVNITLGLPFVRTSVDHGVALDVAGSGDAQGGSLEQALHCAAQLARSRSNERNTASASAAS